MTSNSLYTLLQYFPHNHSPLCTYRSNILIPTIRLRTSGQRRLVISPFRRVTVGEANTVFQPPDAFYAYSPFFLAYLLCPFERVTFTFDTFFTLLDPEWKHTHLIIPWISVSFLLQRISREDPFGVGPKLLRALKLISLALVLFA